MISIDYLLLKSAHISFAVASAGLFVFRSTMLLINRRCTSKLFRLLIHSVDTLLFGLGFFLAVQLALSPFSTPWLGTKLLAIVLYILTGLLLMRTRSRNLKFVSYATSLLLLMVIFYLAIYKPYF